MADSAPLPVVDQRVEGCGGHGQQDVNEAELAQQPRTPRSSSCSGSTPSSSSAGQAVASAADALMDWLETHGGEIRLSGETCNFALVSDGVAWGRRLHADCGRLIPFLRRHGHFAAAQADVVIGVAPSA